MVIYWFIGLFLLKNQGYSVFSIENQKWSVVTPTIE